MSSTYINPVELLNLAGLPAASLDAATIKKARRRLLADLELEDDSLNYKGQQLDRSACERACTELDEPEYLRVWHRLANMPALNDFLGSGSPDFLMNPVSASSLAADSALVRMVGPRYALQYDKALLAAFRTRDITRFQQITTAPALYLPLESKQAHQGLSRLLREKVEELRQQTESFDDDDDASQVVANVTRTLSAAGWPALLNAAPEVFGGLRTEMVLAVRNFSIRLFNTFLEPGPALKLLQEATTLQTDAQTSDRVKEDIRQIKAIEVKQQAQARIDAVAGRFGEAFEQLLAFQKQIEAGLTITNIKAPSTQWVVQGPPSFDMLSGVGAKTYRMTIVSEWGTGLTKLIAELNPMTDPEIVTARDALALGLRGLSVSIWNKNQADGDTAVALLTTGLTLRVSAATTAKLNTDKNQLSRMIGEQKQAALQKAKQFSASVNKSQDTGSGCLIMAVIGIVIAVVVALSSGTSTNSRTSNDTSSTSSVAQASTDQSTNSGYIPPPASLPTISMYRGNQLRNGTSPFDNCFGKGRYAGPAWVEFRNDNNDSDAIVCLAKASNNKVVRNEYIRAGTSFRMSQIPAGTYYLKVFYGRDWNPKRRNACDTKGDFDTDQRFSESRAPDDLMVITSSGRSYTTGTMTLYSVAGGNTAQQSIDASTFFRQ